MFTCLISACEHAMATAVHLPRRAVRAAECAVIYYLRLGHIISGQTHFRFSLFGFWHVSGRRKSRAQKKLLSISSRIAVVMRVEDWLAVECRRLHAAAVSARTINVELKR